MAPDTGERWRGRPVAAGVLRAAVIAVPVIAGLGVAWAVARALPRPEGVGEFILSWLLLIAVSTVVVVVVERFARRVLPLAFLLELSLLFPGEAPSRFRIALRTRGVRDLEDQVESGDADASTTAGTILGLLAAISAHDRRTRGHSERVRAYAAMIGEELGLDEGDVDRLHWAALLHDVGKLRVPPEILNKTGQPDRTEWEVIRRHPTEGARLAAPLMDWLGPWGRAIEQHHEHWDGSGYPRGLSGADISLAARIVAVADAYETMTALRAYNRPLSPERAREELARASGEHFDPQVVRAFLALSVARLRRVAGPLVWLAELPMLAPLRAFAAQPAIGSTTSAAVGVAAVTAVAAVPILGPPPGADVPDDLVLQTVSDVPAPTGPWPADGSRDAPGERTFDPTSGPRPQRTEPAPVATDDRHAVPDAGSGPSDSGLHVGGAAEGDSEPIPTSAGTDEPGAGQTAASDGAAGPEGDPATPAPGATERRRGKPEQPPDPPEHAEADPDPDTDPGTPADPDPHGDA